MHTTDTYTATQEENKPPVLRTVLRNVNYSKQCSPSCKPVSGFSFAAVHQSPRSSLPALWQASATWKIGSLVSKLPWIPLSAWGQLFPCGGCTVHSGKGHVSQAWAELCFSAEKDLYLFINQKPDTKALIYAGGSPSSSAGHGDAQSPCTDRLASDPWAQAAACREPRHPCCLLQSPSRLQQPLPVLHQPGTKQRGFVFLQGPQWCWKQQLCYQHEPCWHCIQQLSAAPGAALHALGHTPAALHLLWHSHAALLQGHGCPGPSVLSLG